MEEAKLKKLITESRELAKTLDKFADELEKTEKMQAVRSAVKNGFPHFVEELTEDEFDRAFLEVPNIEQIIKDTIKEYIDKDCDDKVELLLDLSHDLCERIRKGELMDCKENNIEISYPNKRELIEEQKEELRERVRIAREKRA